MNRYFVLGLAFGLTLGAALIMSARPSAPTAPTAAPSAIADHRTLTTYPGP
jgi:hypothetical protein